MRVHTKHSREYYSRTFCEMSCSKEQSSPVKNGGAKDGNTEMWPLLPLKIRRCLASFAQSFEPPCESPCEPPRPPPYMPPLETSHAAPRPPPYMPPLAVTLLPLNMVRAYIKVAKRMLKWIKKQDPNGTISEQIDREKAIIIALDGNGHERKKKVFRC